MDNHTELEQTELNKMLGQSNDKPKFDVKKILGILGLILLSVSVLGAYFAYKFGGKKEVTTTEVTVAKPIETDKNHFNFGADKLPPNMPEQPVSINPVVQTIQPPVTAIAQTQNETLSKEQAMQLAREKSTLIIKGSDSASVSSAQNGDKKNAPPELQSILGALQGQSPGQKTGFDSKGNWSGQQQFAPSSANYVDSRQYKMLQGRVIPAITVNAIKTNAQCYAIAQVSQPVYGEIGNIELFPAGTRLFGECQSTVSNGQSEIAVIWNRGVTPNGIEIQLDSPATNSIGIAGLSGHVNTHFFQNFANATVMSLLGAGVATAGVNSQDQNNSASQYRMAVAQSLNQQAQNSLSQNQAPPSIEVKQGQRILVLLRKDLDFTTLFN